MAELSSDSVGGGQGQGTDQLSNSDFDHENSSNNADNESSVDGGADRSSNFYKSSKRRKLNDSSDLKDANRYNNNYNLNINSDGASRVKHRHRFWDVPSTTAKKIYCDFEYSNNIIQNPALRSQMQFLQEESAVPFHGILNLGPQSASKCDIYGDTVALSILRPPGFCHKNQIGENQSKYNSKIVDQLDQLLDANRTVLGENKRLSDQEQEKAKQEKLAEIEALFLRRAILVQNDLFTKGDSIIVGQEAAEKNLPRKPTEEQTPQQIIDRIEETFRKSKSISIVHPTDPTRKVKHVYNLIPDAEHWASSFKQVTFDEPTEINENAENPSLFWRNRKPGKTIFGLMTSELNKGNDYHDMERVYLWSNQGEFESQLSKAKATSSSAEAQMAESVADPAGLYSSYVLLSFSNKTSEARFVRISDKIQVKKVKAVLQSGNTNIDFRFEQNNGNNSSNANGTNTNSNGITHENDSNPSLPGISSNNMVTNQQLNLKRKVNWREINEEERQVQDSRFREVLIDRGLERRTVVP